MDFLAEQLLFIYFLLFRPSTSTVLGMNAQMRRMKITPSAANAQPAIQPSSPDLPIINPNRAASPNVHKVYMEKAARQKKVLPKRISLPESLEFQPQMLLNLKQR